jgi:tetratricopeptide (TPR) repeat protein
MSEEEEPPAVRGRDARDRGSTHFRNGDYAGALAAYKEAVALLPGDRAALANRSAALLQLGRLEECLADCEEILKVEPEHARSLSRRAQVAATSARRPASPPRSPTPMRRRAWTSASRRRCAGCAARLRRRARPRRRRRASSACTWRSPICLARAMAAPA